MRFVLLPVALLAAVLCVGGGIIAVLQLRSVVPGSRPAPAVRLTPAADAVVSQAKVEDAAPKTVATDESGIRRIVEQYVKAPYPERHHYVLNGVKLKNDMAAKYAELPPRPGISSVVVEEVRPRGEGRAIASTVIRGAIFAQKSKVYLRKTTSGWLVDWPATVGWNDTVVKVLETTTPRAETALRLTAEISDYYNFQYADAKATHYSIDLTERSSSLAGYVLRESATGRRLYELLRDGAKHDLILAVRWTSEVGSVVEITKVVSPDWFAD